MKMLMLIFFLGSVRAAQAAPESVSVTAVAGGDIRGTYSFSGPLGKTLPGSGGESPCRMSALFRKAVYRGKPSLETWLTLDCEFQGQKKRYKPHRIYLALNTPEEQKIQLPVLDVNLKNIQLIFREISLKLGK